MKLRSFGEGFRHEAPAHWRCTNLEATRILDHGLMVEHHYLPGGEMDEHSAPMAVLCVCIAGEGFVKVGDESSELYANQVVVWPAGKTHKLWTTDASMTVLLIHFPGQQDLALGPDTPANR
jgi:quercetin dioxygenase-like cupin family protein